MTKQLCNLLLHKKFAQIKLWNINNNFMTRTHNVYVWNVAIFCTGHTLSTYFTLYLQFMAFNKRYECARTNYVNRIQVNNLNVIPEDDNLR